jgi:protein-tyrosine phosphatase
MIIHKIAPKLYTSGHPSFTLPLAKHFNTLVLAAKEWQPGAEHFGGLRVIHSPMDDDHQKMSTKDKARAVSAATKVIEDLEQKKRVLVTCWEGRNRSNLIAGLVLILGPSQMTAEEVITSVRQICGVRALSNPHFRHMLFLAEASRKTS